MVATEGFPQWVIWGAFTNDTSTTTLRIQNDFATWFFRIVDYDNYVGADVSITSPADGATVSGYTWITGSVMDIFPVQRVDLYINGNFQQSVTNDPVWFLVDTTLLANDTHCGPVA